MELEDNGCLAFFRCSGIQDGTFDHSAYGKPTNTDDMLTKNKYSKREIP